MFILPHCGKLIRRTALAVCTALICLAMGPLPGTLPAAEASFDVRHKERSRYHEDTQTNATTLSLTEAALHGEVEIGEAWQLRLEGAQQEHTLAGPEAKPRIAADVTLFTPRVRYQSETFRARGTIIFAGIDPQPSLYTPTGEGESLVLPALDLTLTHTTFALKFGAWREFDLLPLPDATYTPVVYQTIYAGLSGDLGGRWRLDGQVGTTERTFPTNFPQERQEVELSLGRTDPLDDGTRAESTGNAKPRGLWRETVLTLVSWHYTLNGEDTNFLKWRNAFRFPAGSVTHALDHTLTYTDTYVVYREGQLPGTTLEVDKTDADLQQRAEYTAWSRIGQSPWFWRAGFNLEQSLVQEAFLEYELKAGITRTL